MEMKLMFCLIGGITFLILAVLGIVAIAKYWHSKGRKGGKDRVWRKPFWGRKKVVLTRKTSRRELLAVLAGKDCDYYTMVKALKFLGLANKDSQMVFHRGDCEKFGINQLMEMADRFWALRWPNIYPAKCSEEISLAAKGLIDDLGLDPEPLDGLIGIIKQKCEADVAEAMEVEILAQAEERRQKLAEKILPFPGEKSV